MEEVHGCRVLLLFRRESIPHTHIHEALTYRPKMYLLNSLPVITCLRLRAVKKCLSLIGWGGICWAHLLLNSFCLLVSFLWAVPQIRYKKTTQQTLHAPALLPPSIFHPCNHLSYLFLTSCSCRLPLAAAAAIYRVHRSIIHRYHRLKRIYHREVEATHRDSSYGQENAQPLSSPRQLDLSTI